MKCHRSRRQIPTEHRVDVGIRGMVQYTLFQTTCGFKRPLKQQTVDDILHQGLLFQRWVILGQVRPQEFLFTFRVFELFANILRCLCCDPLA